MDRKLIDYLPAYIGQYVQIQNITNAQQDEVENLWMESETILSNAFIESANEYAVKRYEDIMGITTNPTFTIEERKFNIIATINGELPYTLEKLHEILETLCGVGGYSVELVYEAYKIEIKVALTAKNNLETVRETVEKIIPCNLERIIELLYNQHSTLGKFTHGELSNYTHYELRNEVVINGN